MVAKGGTGAVLSPSIVMSDAVDLAAAIRARAVSCVEVMAAHLDQIERFNPAVNAIVALRPREVLLREASAADADLARDGARGPLHGLPWAVKDLQETAGIATTYGSPLFADNVPAEDSPLVTRLKAAGAIVVGKTNVPEFGLGSQTYNPVYGATGNAYDPSRTCGGSSGGAAVALALRMVPAADGSDMMGSLRNPAAFNNVVGFRPSLGRVADPTGGDVFFGQLATDGPMGRSVADVAMLLSVLAGYDARAPLSNGEDPAAFAAPLGRDFAGTRLGWVGDFAGHLPTEPGLLDLCRSAFDGFRAVGCAVEEVADVGFPLDAVWESWRVLRHVFAGGGHAADYRDPARRALMKPELVWEVEGALATSALDLRDAAVTRSAWYQAVARLFERYDFLLAPVVQVFPFDKAVHWPKAVGGRPMDTYHRWMESTSIWSLTGLPALSMPAGFAPPGSPAAGLPTGILIVGPNRADRRVLELGHAYERSTRWTERVPPPLLRTPAPMPQAAAPGRL